MKILGLIPARGGSKGIPRKNIKKLGDKELIRYTIETGLQCRSLDQLVVSTEDDEIAAISALAGASVPFLRPAALASDHSPTLDTVLHAMQYFDAQQQPFDAVCLLQPTIPFRSVTDIEAAINAFKDHEADSLISVREVPHTYNPHWVFEVKPGTNFLDIATGEGHIITRRQDLPKAYYRDGSIYISSRKALLEQGSLYGQNIAYHINEQSPDINIDTPADWEQAEAYLKT
ncbi:MAG: acylneuraminate cytidylyltransferase family protein [Bacteroidota bacterium]